MKFIGLLLCFLFSPCLAKAIHPASAAEHAAIQSLIDRANLINDSASPSPNVRDVKKVKADLELEYRKPESLRNSAKIAHWQVELKSLRTTRDQLYQQAIRKTLLAYDLVDRDHHGLPIMPTEPAVHPSFNNRTIHWILVYKDDEPRVLLDSGGKPRTIPAGKASGGGLTGADGVTTMYGKFESPADLALLLYHERVHYDQFTTPGIGDKLTYDEREEAAYRAQYQALGHFGLTAAEKKLFEEFLAGDGKNKPGKIREHNERAKAEKLKRKFSLGLWGSGEPAHVQPRSRTEYAALLKESKDFDSQLADAERDLIAQARKDKEAAEHRDLMAEMKRRSDALPAPVGLTPTRPGDGPPGYVRVEPTRPGDGPVAAHPSPLGAYDAKMLAIRKIAQDACASPPRAVDATLAWIPWAEFHTVTEIQIHEIGLTACELRVFRRLVEFGKTWRPGAAIDAAAVRAAAAEPGTGTPSGGGAVPPTQNHDPVRDRVGRIIGR